MSNAPPSAGNPFPPDPGAPGTPTPAAVTADGQPAYTEEQLLEYGKTCGWICFEYGRTFNQTKE